MISVETRDTVKKIFTDYLEKKGLKMFQPIPLRTDVKDKYITINTQALIDIFPF